MFLLRNCSCTNQRFGKIRRHYGDNRISEFLEGIGHPREGLIFILVTHECSVKPKPPSFVFEMQQILQIINKHPLEEMTIILGTYKMRLVGGVPCRMISRRYANYLLTYACTPRRTTVLDFSAFRKYNAISPAITQFNCTGHESIYVDYIRRIFGPRLYLFPSN